MKWRIIIRTYEHEVAVEELALSALDVALPLEALVANIVPWYGPHMRSRRAEQLQRGGSKADKVVIDGHAKWSRSVCGKPYGQIYHSAPLGKYICRNCSASPLQIRRGSGQNIQHRWCKRHLRTRRHVQRPRCRETERKTACACSTFAQGGPCSHPRSRDTERRTACACSIWTQGGS